MAIVNPGCHSETVVYSRLNEDEHLLFSVGERKNPRHAGFAESNFAFLDRLAQPYWVRVRRELDRWFDDFPKREQAKDLRNRFRKDDDAQHYGAWWERYPYTFLRRSGFGVEVHPSVPGTDNHPDFLVRSQQGVFYVEATTTFSDIEDDREHHRLEAQIMDVVDRVESDAFTISLEFDGIGTENAPRPRDHATDPVLARSTRPGRAVGSQRV